MLIIVWKKLMPCLVGIVVDEDVKHLKVELQRLNFRVIRTRNTFIRGDLCLRKAKPF